MANAHSFEQVYLLWVEISDQTSKAQLVGVFTNRDLALEADKHFSTRRSVIEEWQLNIVREDFP